MEILHQIIQLGKGLEKEGDKKLKYISISFKLFDLLVSEIPGGFPDGRAIVHAVKNSERYTFEIYPSAWIKKAGLVLLMFEDDEILTRSIDILGRRKN